jgi:beta-galactosidase/beta-glucuronidase
MPLVEKTWRFKPEAADAESARDWASPALALDPSWSEIRIGAAWEGQGFVGLDGWAWYRIEVAIPESWRGRQAWLSFEGVDDIYELYVGGRLVARRGDIAKRIDAFNERFSHRITEFVTPGKPCVIAIRVHDWYGSGGIFRPVTLSTAGFSPAGEIVR